MATNKPRPVNYGKPMPCQTCGTMRPYMLACPQCGDPNVKQQVPMSPPPPPKK